MKNGRAIYTQDCPRNHPKYGLLTKGVVVEALGDLEALMKTGWFELIKCTDKEDVICMVVEPKNKRYSMKRGK